MDKNDNIAIFCKGCYSCYEPCGRTMIKKGDLIKINFRKLNETVDKYSNCTDDKKDEEE